MNRLHTLIDGFSRVRILCIGDVMLDKFLYGSVSRISPEAPVPIMKMDRETRMLGGAGNEQFLRRARKIQAPCDGFKHFQPEIRNHGEEIIFNHAAGGTASSFPPHDGVRRWEWRSSARRAGVRNIPEPYIL